MRDKIVGMLHLALTLSLLAPATDVPRAPGFDPPALELHLLPASTPRFEEQLAGTGGVLVGQGVALGLLVGAERALVPGGGDLRHPAPTSLILGVGTELMLVPVLVALCSSAVARAGTPGDFFDALSHSFRTRGAGLALLAALSAASALAQLPILAAAGLIALFASDYLTLPVAASLGLHFPDAPLPALVPGGPPVLDPPPQVGLRLVLPESLRPLALAGGAP
jgi:hypothetical protein